MKRVTISLLAVLALLSALVPLTAWQNTPTLGVLPDSGPNLPATCVVGQIYFKTTATTGLNQCATGNTWTALGGGASGVSSITGDGTLITNSGSTGAVTLTLGTLPAANGGVGTQTDIISGNWGPISGSVSTGAISANNGVRAVRFYLPGKVVISNIDFRIVANLAGSFTGAGIYNAAGTTLLVDTGPVDTGASAGIKTTAPVGGAKTLNAGTYWFAYTCTSATTITAILLPAPTVSTDTVFGVADPSVGLAANASVAGQLPSTLGAITLTNIAPLAVRFR